MAVSQALGSALVKEKWKINLYGEGRQCDSFHMVLLDLPIVAACPIATLSQIWGRRYNSVNS